MNKLSRWVLLLALAFPAFGAGCSANPDDPAAQAELLSDRTKRTLAFENIQRIYHTALQHANSDRTKPEVRAVVDATIGPLVHTYETSAGDLTLGRYVLELLAEMRDPRALPAFQKALDFELDAGERHAQTAANAIRDVAVPEAQKPALVTALERAVNKFPGDRAGNDARPADKVVQIDLIKAIGSLGEPGAEALGRLVTSTNEKFDPAVTLAAAIYLGRVATPATIPSLIQCLFRSVAGGRMPLADFAVAGLVRVGRPAVAPLIRVVRGQDPAATQAATAALAAARAANAGAMPGQTAQTLAKDRAMRALAALGVPEAFPLIAEVARASGDIRPRVDAALMLTQLSLPPAQEAEVRTILTDVLAAATGFENAGARNAILSIAVQTFDAGFLPIVMNSIKNHDENAQVRMSALTTYAMLANKSESAALRAVIDAEPTLENDGLKEQFVAANPLIAVGDACDQAIACWKGKLSDANPLIIRKAAIMLGRFGVGNQEAISALIPLLDHAQAEVRFAALYALDHIVTAQNADVVAKLENLSERDDPVSMQLRPEALRILSRVRTRGAH